MKETAEQSAELKQALKHDPETPELAAEAEAFPLEADEAYFEVLHGRDIAEPGSWVTNRIARTVPALFETDENGEGNGVIHWYCSETCRAAETNDYGEVVPLPVNVAEVPEGSICEVCTVLLDN